MHASQRALATLVMTWTIAYVPHALCMFGLAPISNYTFSNFSAVLMR